MKHKSNLGVRVTQILAIIVVVIAALTSVFYYSVNGSLQKASEVQTVPQLFGKLYLPVETANWEDIAKKGDLILGEAIKQEDLQISQTVMYRASDSSTDSNVIYGNFAIGVVNSIDESGETPVAHIQTKDSQIINVDVSEVFGKATFSVAALGSLMTATQSSLGMFWFVALPICAFIILQLLSIILRIVTGHRYDDEDDDEEETGDRYEYEEEYDSEEEQEDDVRSEAMYEKKYGVEKFKINISEDDYNSYDDEVQEEQPAVRKRFLDTPPRFADIKSETVSTINNDFNLKSDLLRPFLENDEETSRAMDPVSAAGEQKQEGPQKPPQAQFYDAPFADAEDQEYTGQLPTAEPLAQNQTQKAKRLVEEKDDDYQKAMMQQTMEFDLKAIRERMHKQNPDVQQKAQQQEEQQKVLEQILIQVKDQAVDFNFDDKAKQGVEVEKSRTGDGFVIKTPKYRANIKVEIDKNKE